MLSQLRVASPASQYSPKECGIAPDDRWARNMQDDMITAIDLLFKFKAGLDKLHPDCLAIIERMVSLPNNRY